MRSTLAVVALCAVAIGTVGVAEELSYYDQRGEITSAARNLRIVERMVRAERYQDAAQALGEAQNSLKNASEGLDDQLRDVFDRTKQRLGELHAELTTAGVELPALESLGSSDDKNMAPAPTLGTGSAEVGSMERVSFVDNVVPILRSHCGGCHVSGSRGGVSLSSYNRISEHVEVGAGIESHLINVIVSGQMPPEGRSVVSPAETRALVTWINQGAKFDGDDPAKALAQLQKSGDEPESPMPNEPSRPAATRPIPQPTGKETVSFALDVAPLLVESCSGCHGEGGTRAGLSVATFERLWQGGNTGVAIVPGDSGASLLVQKLRGTAEDGARMPQNRPAWPREQIELVARWIDEGATFDGSSISESLARVASQALLSRSTPDQLSENRARRASEQWRLAIPDEKASQATSEHFLALGNLPEQSLEQLATTAEQQAQDVLKFLKQRDETFSKGRITIFAFDHPIDYREFGTMVERRSLPSEMRAHARYDAVYPYVAVVPDDSTPESTTTLLSAQIAQLCIARQAEGRLPAWFANGAGMAIAARLHPRDEIVTTWRDAIPGALASMQEPDGFINGKLPPDATTCLGFGFCDALLQKPDNFHRLVKATTETDDFAAACQSVFKRSPSDLAKMWVAAERRRR